MIEWLIWGEVLLGVGWVLLGLGLLYHPQVIFRVTGFLRDQFLNDALILLQRRKTGVLLVLLGFLSLFLGLLCNAHRPERSRLLFRPPPAPVTPQQE